MVASPSVDNVDGGLRILEKFVARGLAAQRAVDTILSSHPKPGRAHMARPKSGSTKKAFGGYQIAFAGREDTLEKVFGADPISPAEMTKRLWAFVKRNRLSTTAR